MRPGLACASLDSHLLKATQQGAPSVQPMRRQTINDHSSWPDRPARGAHTRLDLGANIWRSADGRRHTDRGGM